MTIEQYEQLTNHPHVAIVNLSPRESECGVCGVPLMECRTGIPFFEGEPVPHDWQGDWVGRDACPTCFAAYEATQVNTGDVPRAPAT